MAYAISYIHLPQLKWHFFQLEKVQTCQACGPKSDCKVLYQDLSYGEILSNQPGAWLVKRICFMCIQPQNFKKDLILKLKTISRTCLLFMIAFTIYE